MVSTIKREKADTKMYIQILRCIFRNVKENTKKGFCLPRKGQYRYPTCMGRDELENFVTF